MKVCKVLRPGFLSTVQDLGRRGHYSVGIPEGKAFDSLSLMLGNRLLGNSLNAAGLEVLWGGLCLEFLKKTWVAVTGANLGAKIDDQDVPMWQTISVAPGQKLHFPGRRNGLRAYLLLAGGIDVPLFLGSRSTYLFLARGGHQGRKLVTGDVLSTFSPSNEMAPCRMPSRLQPSYDPPWHFRMVYGLQYELITADSLKHFESEYWTVSSESNRIGLRLSGPTLEFKKRFDARIEEMGGRDPSNIPTEGNPLGTIQCPSGSQLIIIGPDGPCEGGYAKVGTIISADFHLLGQVMPEDKVTFRPVSLQQAYDALGMQKSLLENPTTVEML
jgi:biotin-dependent carboxylase-like uncharacterized protein